MREEETRRGEEEKIMKAGQGGSSGDKSDSAERKLGVGG